jgi:hypothetical protein
MNVARMVEKFCIFFVIWFATTLLEAVAETIILPVNTGSMYFDEAVASLVAFPFDWAIFCGVLWLIFDINVAKLAVEKITLFSERLTNVIR